MVLGSMAFSVALLATPMLAFQNSQQMPPDNTGQNKQQTGPTAD
jgi:hypothetical protein